MFTGLIRDNLLAFTKKVVRLESIQTWKSSLFYYIILYQSTQLFVEIYRTTDIGNISYDLIVSWIVIFYFWIDTNIEQIDSLNIIKSSAFLCLFLLVLLRFSHLNTIYISSLRVLRMFLFLCSFFPESVKLSRPTLLNMSSINFNNLFLIVNITM